MLKVVEIMARIRAIHSSAKRYHWQCNGPQFQGDHLLFDKIADTFTEDDVDALAESWYMKDGRQSIGELNELDLLVPKFVTPIFNEELLYDKNSDTLMFKYLRDAIQELIGLLNTDIFGQGIHAKFDEMVQKYDAICGQIDGRIALQTKPKVFSRLNLN